MFVRPIRRLVLTLVVGIIAAIVDRVLYRRPVANAAKTIVTSHQKPHFSSSSPSHPSTSATDPMTQRKPVVVVVGSGLAGLAAAHEALKAGAAVRMLDRAPKPGGNSIKASSGINGAGTRFQKAAGVADRDDLFYDDTVRSAGARFKDAAAAAAVDRPRLAELLTASSRAAVEWLVDEVGVDLSVVAPLGGHSLARTHRGSGKTPPGAAIVTALLKKLGENPNFVLENSAEVTSLKVAADVVTGVRYVVQQPPPPPPPDDGGERRREEKKAVDLDGAVVFAAGGFAGDANGLLAKHRPDLAGLPSTNEARPASHGILEAVGAEFVDMDSVQVHPTGFVDPEDPRARYKFLAAEMLRGEGGILLASAAGKEGTACGRFVNEMETREHVSGAIMRRLSPSPIISGEEEEEGGGEEKEEEMRGEEEEAVRQWDVTLLMDPGACEAAEGHLGFYLWKGLMEKKKVKDLGPDVIEAVDEYAAAVASGTDAAFGRRDFGRWRLKPGEGNREEEVCLGRVTPITHFTMGGASFNADAQVLRHDKTAVGGLWAAGEITGGVHGDNRLGGSSLLECVVFGRIAGRQAAKAAAASS